MDGIQVVFGALGEGISSADQTAGAGSQGAKPTLHVVGFAFRFAAAAMGFGRKRRGVGFPVVATGGAPAVILGQRGLKIAGTGQTSVAQGPGHDLAGSSTKGHPQPELAGFAAHETPEFVQVPTRHRV